MRLICAHVVPSKLPNWNVELQSWFAKLSATFVHRRHIERDYSLVVETATAFDPRRLNEDSYSRAAPPLHVPTSYINKLLSSTARGMRMYA